MDVVQRIFFFVNIELEICFLFFSELFVQPDICKRNNLNRFCTVKALENFYSGNCTQLIDNNMDKKLKPRNRNNIFGKCMRLNETKRKFKKKINFEYSQLFMTTF